MSGVDDTFSKVQGMGGCRFQRLRGGAGAEGSREPALVLEGDLETVTAREENEVQKDIVRYCLDV